MVLALPKAAEMGRGEVRRQRGEEGLWRRGRRKVFQP